MMSQFMNGATRVKGWTSTDLLLDSWVEKFNSQLKVQTELIEQRKNHKNDAQSTEHKPSYIQPSVIKLSDNQPFFESNNEECESVGDQLEDFFQCTRVSYDHHNIEGPSYTKFVEEANESQLLFNDCSRSSGDWSSFDIQRMFFAGPPQEYV